MILLSDGIVILCIARCLLRWAGLDANHPLARFCIQATDWLVKPIRKLVPPQGKWDVACILAGLLFYYAVFILIRLTASSEGFGGRVIAVNFIFAVLQQNVTSKGGTTHEAIETFKAGQVAETVAKGVASCVNRSRELAKQFEAV